MMNTEASSLCGFKGSKRSFSKVTAVLSMVAALLGFSLPMLNAHASVVLIEDGKPNGGILIPANAPDSVEFAAKELQLHLEEMSGAHLPILVEGQNPYQRFIVSLGETNFASANMLTSSRLQSDGFLIQEIGNVMVILGKDYHGPPLGDRNGNLRLSFNKKLKINAHGETGTQFGVYRFLHDQGVRWYFPGRMGMVLPKQSRVTYDGVSIKDSPYFPYRRLHGFTFNDDPEAAIWYKRIGYGTPPYLNINHSFTDWAKRFSSSHPEYFATIDGQPHFKTVREKNRVILNFTDPGVLRQVLADGETYFLKNPEETLFAVVPNDSHVKHDETENTLKRITQPKYSPGWLSDLVWGFVNEVAHNLAKNQPGKEVGSLAYAYQFVAPTNIEKFEENVVVMHCRYRRNFWNPEYKEFVWKNLNAYTALKPARQYIWEYYNLRSRRENLQYVPFVMPRIIAEDINALKGISSGEFIQATQSSSSTKLVNPAYYHVNLYVTAKFLWNPDADVDALLDEYYKLYYGPAEQPMRLFWEKLEELWTTQGQSDEIEMLIRSKSPGERSAINRKLMSYSDTCRKL